MDKKIILTLLALCIQATSFGMGGSTATTATTTTTTTTTTSGNNAEHITIKLLDGEVTLEKKYVQLFGTLQAVLENPYTGEHTTNEIELKTITCADWEKLSPYVPWLHTLREAEIKNNLPELEARRRTLHRWLEEE